MRNDDCYARLSRIVDRDESPEDWKALEAAARTDPEVWTELAALLRDDCELRHALAPSLARASFVDPLADCDARDRQVPNAESPARDKRDAEGVDARAAQLDTTRRGSRTVRLDSASDEPRNAQQASIAIHADETATHGGQELVAAGSARDSRRSWAWFSLGFAAALICAFVLSFGPSSMTKRTPRDDLVAKASGGTSTPSGAKLATAANNVNTKDDVLLAQYIEAGQRSGRVVQELPSVTLDIKSAGDEGLQVLFVRRIVEQKRIKGAWRFAQDEHGSAVPVRADPGELEVGQRF